MKSLILLLSLAAASAQEPLPEARQIIERFTKMTGGEEAWKAVHSQSMTGKFSLPALGMQAPIKIYADSEGRTYQVIEMPGAGKVEAGNNGDVEWERSLIMGPKVKRRASVPGGLLHLSPTSRKFWDQKFGRLVTTGIDKSDGKPCYMVEVTPGEAKDQQDHCYDVESGLLVRTAVPNPLDKTQKVVMELKDYRKIGDILSPFLMTTKVMGQAFQIEFAEVKLNEKLPSEVFETPDEIKALLAKEDKNNAKATAEEEANRPKFKRADPPK